MLLPPANLVAMAKATIDECTVGELQMRLDDSVLLIDIREPAEYQRGHIPGAVPLPRGLLEFEIHGLVDKLGSEGPPEDCPIILYCGTGGRSALATESLGKLGYRNVTSFDGGMVAWSQAGLPVSTPGE